MSYTAITPPNQGDTTQLALINAVISNLADHEVRLLAIGTISGLKNGSFESDSDGDHVPDSWTWTAYDGGDKLLDTSDQQHSGKSFKITSPGGSGLGGGYLETTDFFEVSPLNVYRFYWEMKSSVAGVNNRVEVLFYTAAQASISTSTLYNSTSNPTSWSPKTASVRPPSTARYAKLRIIGCHTSVTTAGSTWFDNFWFAAAHYDFTRRVEFNNNGNFTFTCPAGVTQARVTCIGGGGGGGDEAYAGGGGGGGVARSVLTVTAGTSYAVTVGSAGGAGEDGGDSSFNGGVVIGEGGVQGEGSGAGGAGGSGTGDEVFDGQAGTEGVTGTTTVGMGGLCQLGGAGGGTTSNATAGHTPGGGGASNSSGGTGRVIIEY